MYKDKEKIGNRVFIQEFENMLFEMALNCNK